MFCDKNHMTFQKLLSPTNNVASVWCGPPWQMVHFRWQLTGHPCHPLVIYAYGPHAQMNVTGATHTLTVCRTVGWTGGKHHWQHENVGGAIEWSPMLYIDILNYSWLALNIDSECDCRVIDKSLTDTWTKTNECVGDKLPRVQGNHFRPWTRAGLRRSAPQRAYDPQSSSELFQPLTTVKIHGVGGWAASYCGRLLRSIIGNFNINMHKQGCECVFSLFSRLPSSVSRPFTWQCQVERHNQVPLS